MPIFRQWLMVRMLGTASEAYPCDSKLCHYSKLTNLDWLPSFLVPFDSFCNRVKITNARQN